MLAQILALIIELIIDSVEKNFVGMSGRDFITSGKNVYEN